MIIKTIVKFTDVNFCVSVNTVYEQPILFHVHHIRIVEEEEVVFFFLPVVLEFNYATNVLLLLQHLRGNKR